MLPLSPGQQKMRIAKNLFIMIFKIKKEKENDSRWLFAAIRIHHSDIDTMDE
jgi:hypothetical protein